MHLYDRLEKAWAEQGRFHPRYYRLTFTDHGVEIGSGVVLVGYLDDDWGRKTLAIEGQEERILTLLSVAWNHPMPDHILDHFHDASRALSKGQLAQACIHLAFTGLQSLDHESDSFRLLFIADALLDAGFSGNQIRKAWSLGQSNFQKSNPNVCEEPRDGKGCWTVSGYTTSKTPEQILAEAKAAGGWLHAPDVTARNLKECVSFVRAAVPGLDHASEWRQGDQIKGIDNPPLEPGTAIATFNVKGEYPMEKGARHHAAIFLGYGKDANGNEGMWVLDQSKYYAVQRHFMPFNRPQGDTRYRAGEFSVITVPKKSKRG